MNVGCTKEDFLLCSGLVGTIFLFLFLLCVVFQKKKLKMEILKILVRKKERYKEGEGNRENGDVF